MTEYKVRLGTEQDSDFLWEMLYQAIYVLDKESKPSREILNHPDISKYLLHYGKKGDLAFIATDTSGKLVGAIWIRLFDEMNKTYGYIDKDTPVVSMAVLTEYRGQGIGTLLLNKMLKEAKASGFTSLSLSVDPNNPALRLYERHGFVKVGIDGTSWDMKTTL